MILNESENRLINLTKYLPFDEAFFRVVVGSGAMIRLSGENVSYVVVIYGFIVLRSILTYSLRRSAVIGGRLVDPTVDDGYVGIGGYGMGALLS